MKCPGRAKNYLFAVPFFILDVFHILHPISKNASLTLFWYKQFFLEVKILFSIVFSRLVLLTFHRIHFFVSTNLYDVIRPEPFK